MSGGKIMAVLMNKKDEMIMRLVHYFITEENYSPIVVNGVKDEIWLQNQDGPYKIIRINANYIHNKEQMVKLHNYHKLERLLLAHQKHFLHLLHKHNL